MLTFWCLATSTLGQGFLGLLGPAIVVWLWQVEKSEAFEARGGPKADIMFAKKNLKFAKISSWVLFTFWLASVILYFGTYNSVSGKGCDAELVGSARCWVTGFIWSLLPLLLATLLVAFFYLKFQKHDENAKTASR